MDLTPIQIKLRELEKQISALQDEIEDMKPKSKEESKDDFKLITILAGKDPVENTVIKAATPEIKKTLFEGLAYLALTKDAIKEERLFYLCRLAKGSGFDVSAEQLYQLGLEFGPDQLERYIHLDKDYKYTFLIEAMMLVNMIENASDETLAQIADMAVIMECSKEELRVLGLVAKGVLSGDLDCVLDMPLPEVNIWSGRLRDFLPESWIESHRICCGSFCTTKKIPSYDRTRTEKTTIIMQLNSGAIVKKGTVLCKYEELVPDGSRRKRVERTITAECNGVLQVQDYTEEHVTSYTPIVSLLYSSQSQVSMKTEDVFQAFYVTTFFDYDNRKG